MSERNITSGTTVTSKIVAILEAFTGERVVMSMSEIARASGLASSTAHRLIQELTDGGVLERLHTGGYVVGVRLWEIAAHSTRTYGLRETAMPFLQGLWDVTRAHVLLAVLDGDEALIVERIAGTKAVPPAGRAGGRLPLHASSVGKVLLAYASAEAQERVMNGALVRYTPRTVDTPEALRLALAHVRRTGVATSEEELTPASTSCAALVSGRSGQIAAISILGTTGERDLREMKLLIQSTARGLTHALKNPGPQTPISPALQASGLATGLSSTAPTAPPTLS